MMAAAETLLTLLMAGKFLYAIKFIAFRAAGWLGIGFFYKKGKHSGKKRFYWFAFLVWLVSWATVLYFSPRIWRRFAVWMGWAAP